MHERKVPEALLLNSRVFKTRGKKQVIVSFPSRSNRKKCTIESKRVHVPTYLMKNISGLTDIFITTQLSVSIPSTVIAIGYDGGGRGGGGGGGGVIQRDVPYPVHLHYIFRNVQIFVSRQKAQDPTPVVALELNSSTTVRKHLSAFYFQARTKKINAIRTKHARQSIYTSIPHVVCFLVICGKRTQFRSC